jgi:hypothetical protein
MAVICLEDTNVVARAVPFHSTVAPETNSDPDTVIVVSDAPAMTFAGLTELTEGVGLDGGAASVETLETAAEPPPPHAARIEAPTSPRTAPKVLRNRFLASNIQAPSK